MHTLCVVNDQASTYLIANAQCSKRDERYPPTLLLLLTDDFTPEHSLELHNWEHQGGVLEAKTEDAPERQVSAPLRLRLRPLRLLPVALVDDFALPLLPCPCCSAAAAAAAGAGKSPRARNAPFLKLSGTPEKTAEKSQIGVEN